MLKNTQITYGSIAKCLHWIIAILIIGMIIAGFVMDGMESSPTKLKIYGLHKSIGISILLLAVIRLIWKLANVQPLLPERMRKIEKLAAHAGHAGLYALMFAMPLTGWLMSSAAGLPVSVFGMPPLPNLVEPDKALSHQFKETHEFLAWVLIALVAAHVAAALLHHFYWRDNVLRRMLPSRRMDSTGTGA